MWFIKIIKIHISWKSSEHICSARMLNAKVEHRGLGADAELWRILFLENIFKEKEIQMNFI